MFCKNCGKELEADSKFCSQCGTSVEGKKSYSMRITEFVNGLNVKEFMNRVNVKEFVNRLNVKEFVKANKKMLTYILTGVIIVTIVIIAILIFGGKGKNSTPEKVAGNFVVALYKIDAEGLVDCIPDFYVRKMAQLYGITDGNRKNLIKKMKSEISSSSSSSSSHKRNCVLLNAERYIDSYVLGEYMNDMDSYGATYEEISKIENYCLVEVSVLVDGENAENIVFCVKIDGSWYALDID